MIVNIALKMQNPGGQAGALRDLLSEGWSQQTDTVISHQAQRLILRHGLLPWLACDVASLCFGEARND